MADLIGERPMLRIALCFLVFSFAWVVVCEARQRDSHLAGELQTHRTVEAFSGETVEIVFQIVHGPRREPEVRGDLFQLGGRLAAPTVKDLAPVSSSAGEAVTEARFVLDLPEVEKRTEFHFRLKRRIPDGDQWEKIGEAGVVVHPPLDWEALQEASEKIAFWTKAEGPVTRFLRDRGVRIHSPGALPLREQKGVILWEAAATDDEIPEIAARGQEILIFYGRHAGDGLPRVDQRLVAGVVDVYLEFPEDLLQSAEARITLHRIMESVLDRHRTVGAAAGQAPRAEGPLSARKFCLEEKIPKEAKREKVAETAKQLASRCAESSRAPNHSSFRLAGINVD